MSAEDQTPADKHTKSVRAGYDRWSEVYDHDANPLVALEDPHVRAAVGNVADLDVLDLGCGTGRHTVWLADAGARVTAIDFSPGMLAEARRKADGSDIRFIAHDLHKPLPIDDGSFDIVVSGLVLEHLRDLGCFFREARRVLRPQGRAVISAMHPAMFLRDSKARFVDPASGLKVTPGSVPHQVSDFLSAALEAGFFLQQIDEFAPDTEFAAEHERAEKYTDWPMLVLMQLGASPASPAPNRSNATGDQDES